MQSWVTRVHLAILVASAAGPVPMVALARSLPSWAPRNFGREFAELLDAGMLRLRDPFCQCELTPRGRAVLESQWPAAAGATGGS